MSGVHAQLWSDTLVLSNFWDSGAPLEMGSQATLHAGPTIREALLPPQHT